jgi:transcriptional regulator with XRE-family HTH domain
VAKRRLPEADLHRVLREELTARNWGVRQLSDALGVRYGVVARWVSENASTRVVPLPSMLVRLADLLDLNVYDVFRHAGYLPAVNSDNGQQHPHEEQIRVLERRLRRLLRGIPDKHWPLAVSVVSLDLDQLQVLLNHLEEFNR